MRIIKRLFPLIAALALCICPPAALCEGDPLLSVDDLMLLEESYEAFLTELEDLVIERGLLSESERKAWHDAQMGDFFQNGGYICIHRLRDDRKIVVPHV